MGMPPTIVVSRTVLRVALWLGVCLLVAGCETPPRTEISFKPSSSAYDRLLVEAVRDRWYKLLKADHELVPVAGKVVIRFKLHSDGEVTDVCVVETAVPPVYGLLCEKAICDPAPYGEWSREMRMATGADERNITFTFYYNDPQPRPRTIREVFQLRHAHTDEER